MISCSRGEEVETMCAVYGSVLTGHAFVCAWICMGVGVGGGGCVKGAMAPERCVCVCVCVVYLDVDIGHEASTSLEELVKCEEMVAVGEDLQERDKERERERERERGNVEHSNAEERRQNQKRGGRGAKHNPP